MKKIIKIKVILVLILSIGFGSCTKDWEELNTNPNEPVVVPATNVLAYSLRYFADNFYDEWMSMNNISTYVNHVVKIQYIDESTYQERESVINDAWRDVYTTLLSLKRAEDLAVEEGNEELQGAIITFQVFILQKVTDLWNAVPWSEALQGEDGITNPAYDTQEDIYKNYLFAMLENANTLLTVDPGENVDLGVGDLVYGGDIGQWRKFCNSLRLRIAIRISNVEPGLAQQHIEEILGDPVTFPIFTSNDDNAFLWWQGSLPYMEPWAENSIADARDDHGMCETLIDNMKDNNDPRLPVYAHPAESDGEYRGLDAGAVDGSFALADISRIGSRYRDDEAGFSPFMRYSEVLFIISEAANNGWNTGGFAAQTAYEDAIQASMDENEVEIGGYLSEPNVAWDGTNENIYMQKWIALFKQGHEAWAENRRTDVPLLGPATDSFYPGHNRPPFRFKYPTDEFNLNSANISGFTGGLDDHFWGTNNGKMWWDTRTGVN